MLSAREQYTVGAKIYDVINEDDAVLFSERVVDKILELGFKFDSCVEYGCGTGLILNHIAKNCMIIAGCDISREMLVHASDRLQNNAFLKNVDMRLFKTDCKYKLALCVNDCINYLPKIEEWRRFIENVSESIVSGGLFILEYDTLYDLREIWNDNINVYENDNFMCIKTYNYNSSENFGEERQLYFIRHNLLWDKFVEVHRQYSFTQNEVIELCISCGFSIRAMQDADTGEDFIEGESLRCILYLQKI